MTDDLRIFHKSVREFISAERIYAGANKIMMEVTGSSL
jgi:hypothetical protein